MGGIAILADDFHFVDPHSEWIRTPYEWIRYFGRVDPERVDPAVHPVDPAVDPAQMERVDPVSGSGKAESTERNSATNIKSKKCCGVVTRLETLQLRN